MPLYAYKAMTSDGVRVRGQLEALHLHELETRLQRLGQVLINAKPIRQRMWIARRVKRQELIHFCFHLEQLLEAKIPLLEGLNDLCDSVEDRHFKECMRTVLLALEGGKTLAQALAQQKDAFGAVFVHLIRAGEISGQLPEVLRELAAALKWEDELRAQTGRVLLYPAFVALVVGIACSFLMVYMVPQLKNFVASMGQDLPLQTRLLFAFSDFLSAYAVWLLPSLFLFLLVLAYLLRHSAAVQLAFDRYKLHIPGIGMTLRKIALARFANTLALLYAAKVPLLEALKITRHVLGNRYIEAGVASAEQAICEGQSLSAAFEQSGLFTPLILRMLRVGENTGALDKALRNVNYFYHRDVREAVEKVQQLVEPVLTVFLGVLLGWIMLSVLAPIYEIISKVKP